MAWSDCLLNPVTCAVDGATGSAANSVWDSFLRWAARGLTDMTTFVFKAFSSSTSPRFDQQWWSDNLRLMMAVSLPILVGLFVLQCVSAAVRREPGGLGRALVGALIGTAGVPLAVAIVASCGKAVDEISVAILGGPATSDGLKRMVDLSIVLSAGTLGGFLLVAVFLGLTATISLYVVMLLRYVAIVAFVVFAPLALASWTWSATRHWLRRWLEVVGALVFAKVPMAIVFALGISATGNGGSADGASIGTFLAGILLFAMAALAPMATFQFVHWVGDQSQAAGNAVQQGMTGATAAKEKNEQFQQWRAEHFGSSGEGVPDAIVGDDSDQDSDDSSVAGWTEDDLGGDQSQRTSSEAAGGNGESNDEGGTGSTGQESFQTTRSATSGQAQSDDDTEPIGRARGLGTPNTENDPGLAVNPVRDVSGDVSQAPESPAARDDESDNR